MRCLFISPSQKVFPFKYKDDNSKYDELKQRIISVIDNLCKQGFNDFYAPLIGDIDTFFANTIISFKQQYKELHFTSFLETKKMINGECSESSRSNIDQADVVVAIGNPQDLNADPYFGSMISYSERLHKKIIFVSITLL